MGVAESKIAFKQTVVRLLQPRPIDPADPLWRELCTLPDSADDVFSFLSAGDIRQLLCPPPGPKPGPADGPAMAEPARNLVTLIYVAVARLEQLQTRPHVFPDDPPTAHRQIANCMSILTRLMPFIYEAEHLHPWYRRFFWEPQRPTCLDWDGLDSRPTPLYDGLRPDVRYHGPDADKDIGPPLGPRLLAVVARYLFFAGFTLPKRQAEDGRPDREISLKVWQSGIGSGSSLPLSADNFRHQYETVRLLLTLASGTMYMRPDQVAVADNQPLTYLTTQLNQRMINAINCSLLNTVMRFQPSVWSMPIGWEGVRDSKKVLVVTCLQFLLVSMVYMPPLGPDGKSAKNLFRSSMASLFRPDDFQFMHHGIKLVLEQPVSANRSFVAKSDVVPWAPEMLSFLWEMVQCNKKFRRYLCDTRIALDYFVLLLFYVVDGIRDLTNTKLGIVRMGVCILQSLSTDAAFADQLNAPFPFVDALPDMMRIPNFHGSYADFLVSSLHDIITTTEERMEPVYAPCVDIVKNISPYQRHLERATSSKMMRILEKLAAPSYLLRNEAHHAVLHALLQAYHAILENHLEENPQFVKVLVASKHRFLALRHLTGDPAVAALDRRALECTERGEPVPAPSPCRPSGEGGVRPNHPNDPNGPNDRVAEHDRSAVVGEDEDEDGPGESAESAQSGRAVTPLTSDGGSDAHLSERARGKKPMSAREAARDMSTTASLPAPTPAATLHTSTTTPPHPGREHCRGQSPLQDILRAIDHAESRRQHVSARNSTSPHGHLPRATGENQSLEGGRQARRSAQLPRQSAERPGDGAQAARGADGQGHLPPAKDIQPAAGGPVGFQWTAAAVGWYNALIWSRIYLQEGEAFQGPHGLYSATEPRLFRRQSAREEVSLRNPKGAIDAVGNSLAQRIGSLSITGPSKEHK